MGNQGLPGAMGIPGNIGPRGPEGLKGEVGEKGESGPVGTKGSAGIPGNIGPRGFRGLKGENGMIGIKGEKGDTAIFDPRQLASWKQCAWRGETNTDNGKIKVSNSLVYINVLMQVNELRCKTLKRILRFFSFYPSLLLCRDRFLVKVIKESMVKGDLRRYDRWRSKFKSSQNQTRLFFLFSWPCVSWNK